MLDYPEKVMFYFKDLQHAGTIPAASGVYCLEQGNEEQGNQIRIWVRLQEVVKEARFQCYGSAISIAACEFLCCWLEGKNLEKIATLETDTILSALSLSSLYVSVAARLVHMTKSLLKNEG